MHAFWTMFGSIVRNKKTRHRLPPAPDHPRSPAVRSETRPPGSFNTRPKSCSPSPSSLRFQSKRLQSEKILYLSVQFVMGRPGTITNPNLIWGLSECLPCTVLSLFFHLQNYIPHTRGFKKIALTEGGPAMAPHLRQASGVTHWPGHGQASLESATLLSFPISSHNQTWFAGKP